MMPTTDLGKILKQHRLIAGLTLRQLSATSGLSLSHLGRIERRERFPSARTLRKVAEPLGFEEGKLFSLAGYLSPRPSAPEERTTDYNNGRLDPYVDHMLSQEPVEVQRTVISILNILKSIARTAREN